MPAYEVHPDGVAGVGAATGLRALTLTAPTQDIFKGYTPLQVGIIGAGTVFTGVPLTSPV